MPRTPRVTDVVRGHGKSLLFVGTALAFAGAGTASAAAAAPSAFASTTALASHSAATSTAQAQAAAVAQVGQTATPPAAAVQYVAAFGSSAQARAARTLVSQVPDTGNPADQVSAGQTRTTAPAHASQPPAAHASVSFAAADSPASTATTAKAAPAKAKAVKAAATQAKAAPARHASPTWKQVRDELNVQTNPVAAHHGKLPLPDRLLPVTTSGPQAYMPISTAQYRNATTIVSQALNRHMGVRSAVIAVATSMQESRLLNIDYGTSDSLGLFQQRPSCGWGTPGEIMNPVYAANAFLTALEHHQSDDPGWAAQPLWANAQAVQDSAFPFAYAKWESQAAHLVANIATQREATQIH